MTDEIALLGEGLKSGGWEPIKAQLEEYGYQHKIINTYDSLTGSQRLGILLNHNNIVPQEQLNRPQYGFVLFHSSDLPRGRGWAPIYNTIARDLPLVQTMLFATKDVDAGPIIAKAKYPLDGTELEAEVQDIDDKLTLCLLEDCLRDVIEMDIDGKQQANEGISHWEKRSQPDSEIKLSDELGEVVDHLRALPSESPAFFEYKGRTYEIKLTPDTPTERHFNPENVTLERYYEW